MRQIAQMTQASAKIPVQGVAAQLLLERARLMASQLALLTTVLGAAVRAWMWKSAR
jgi:hypothetical protein